MAELSSGLRKNYRKVDNFGKNAQISRVVPKSVDSILLLLETRRFFLGNRRGRYGRHTRVTRTQPQSVGYT